MQLGNTQDSFKGLVQSNPEELKDDSSVVQPAHVFTRVEMINRYINSEAE